MTAITYQEWEASFVLKQDIDSDLEDESLTFFDNGAVQNADGDFIVKIDQVRRV